MRRIINIIAIAALCVNTLNSQTLTLDSCFALARRNSYAIKTARMEVDEAREVKSQALTKYFPQVALSAMGYKAFEPLVEMKIEDVANETARDNLERLYNAISKYVALPNSITMMSQGVMAHVNAVQPVYMGGRIVNGNRLAKAGVEAAEMKRLIAERDALLAVEESYWIVVDLEAKRQTVEAVQSVLDTVQNVAGAAVRAGLAVQNDLLEIELRQNELAAQTIRLNNGITLARQALCQSIGISYDENLRLDTLSGMTATAEMVDMSEAVKSRPEYALLGIQIKAEQLKRRMTIGESLPTVMLGATYGYSNMLSPFDPSARYQFVTLDQRRFVNGLVGMTVTVPVTGWWETSHKLRQNDIRIKRAELEKREYAEKMELQTRQAFNSMVESEALVRQYASSVVKARENLRLARVNYESGLQTVTDILQAQALLLQAENSLVDARIENRMAVRRYEAYVKGE